MSHLNIAFDRYASIGSVMHYILVISIQTVGDVFKFLIFIIFIGVLIQQYNLLGINIIFFDKDT